MSSEPQPQVQPYQGFARLSVAVPAMSVGDVEANGRRTLALWRRSHAQGDALVAFPELGLVGYTLRDLLHDRRLLRAALDTLELLLVESRALDPLAIIGLPLWVEHGLYNVAVAVHKGEILGIVPKSYLPAYREFEEHRWFRPGLEVDDGATARVLGRTVPFGTDLLFEADAAPDLVVGLEICEDVFVQVPPSALQVGAGATVVCNLSASNFTVGKADLRRLLARSLSDRGKCAYLYVAAGPGESSTDLAFDADAFICENGRELVASRRFCRDDQLVTADVDLELLTRERISHTTFGSCAAVHRRIFRKIPFSARDGVTLPLRRAVSAHPFVPDDPRTLGERCWEIFEIQTHALVTRMSALGEPKLVLGVSGGLDSTQAALVCAAALDLVGRPRSDLLCLGMPGLGTTETTRTNARRLVEALGATFQEVSIADLSHRTLAAIGHPAAAGAATTEALLERVANDPRLGDVTLENVQARLRTLVLMSVANDVGGLVVGTGDLSEKALGWSTYAGDQISMYDVNASIPKTLVRFVIRWVANERVSSWTSGDPQDLKRVLFDILDTPITPELLPAANGEIAQLTEEAIGPYELHDFFLYHFVRHGARPARILDLARVAFAARYDLATLKTWLTVFLRRFFAHQFKRSATADGPKVGQVALSPRGDWRMPSDARVDTWLAELDAYPDE